MTDEQANALIEALLDIGESLDAMLGYFAAFEELLRSREAVVTVPVEGTVR